MVYETFENEGRPKGCLRDTVLVLSEHRPLNREDTARAGGVSSSKRDQESSNRVATSLAPRAFWQQPSGVLSLHRHIRPIDAERYKHIQMPVQQVNTGGVLRVRVDSSYNCKRTSNEMYNE